MQLKQSGLYLLAASLLGVRVSSSNHEVVEFCDAHLYFAIFMVMVEEHMQNLPLHTGGARGDIVSLQ